MSLFEDPNHFSETLYKKMMEVNPGIDELELYEFRYALDNITPPSGWGSVDLTDRESLEILIQRKDFYAGIQLRPIRDGHIVLDDQIIDLTQMLMVGLMSGFYSLEWINRFFYFDIRAFVFFVRTVYFTPEIQKRLGGKPYRWFETTQDRLAILQDVGYREFQAANHSIDLAFLEDMQTLIDRIGPPIVLTIVGPTAAGKTEIVARLQEKLARSGRQTTTVEMDQFLKDGEYRDGKPMGPEVIHFDIFKRCMTDLALGKKAFIPRYDFTRTTSSHDADGRLRPGQQTQGVDPADIVLLEGNFPFYLAEIAPLIGIKIVYLTDDPIRLKRKWRRDIDYRKKYDPAYFCNRYFRTQFLRAEEVYRPLLQVCDLVVDTTHAELWTTPEITARIK